MIESLIESPKSLEIAKKIMSISHTIHLIYYQYYSHSNNNKSTVSEDSGSIMGASWEYHGSIKGIIGI